MDWNAIREEYITDESCSYRKLAQKHGVSLTAITRHSKTEDWQGQRQRIKDKTITKSLEKISDRQAERATKFLTLSDILTAKIAVALEKLDPGDTKALRRLAASLKDLKEIQGMKSDADQREQNARIKNLEKQTEQNAEAPTIVVTFDQNEEYSK